jgi:hypothetical protein
VDSVDDDLEGGGALERQVAGIGALQDAGHVPGSAVRQQQAALMHAHGESVRLQGLLNEHVRGRGRESIDAPAAVPVAPLELVQSSKV